MKEKNKQISFALLGIKTEQFAIFEENYTPALDKKFGVELQFKLNKQNNQIGVFVGIELVQLEKIFIKLVVSCHFKIENKSWDSLIEEENSKIIIPKDFLAHLSMISIGTVRGVLYGKTEGTEFSKFILPTLNVASMIKEDAIFEIESK